MSSTIEPSDLASATAAWSGGAPLVLGVPPMPFESALDPASAAAAAATAPWSATHAGMVADRTANVEDLATANGVTTATLVGSDEANAATIGGVL